MMKRRGRIGLSLLLAVVVLIATLPLSGCLSLLSEWFQPGVYHGEVDFSEMEYTHLETTEFDSLADEIVSLMEKARNADKVLDKFDRMWEIYNDFYDQYTMAYIYNTLDVTNSYYADEVLYITNTSTVLYNKLVSTAQSILQSPCGKKAKRYWGDAFVSQMETVTTDTPEQMALLEQENNLLARYKAASVKEYADLIEKNSVLGAIYLELIGVRSQIAQSYGYDNYASFSYEYLYKRDYTPEEALNLCRMVKEKAVDLQNRVNAAMDSSAWEQLNQYVAGMPSKTRLALVQAYLPELSSDFEESFQYMLDYHLYDIEYSEKKMGISYTTVISKYNAPFLFSQPYGGFYDLQTIIHEFGHYNAYYHGNASVSTSEDIAEIHSQTMELLYIPFYDDMLGEKNGRVATLDILSSILSSLIQGCMMDEFQQLIYQNPEITLDEINQLFFRLAEEYGLVNEGNRMEIPYYWVEVAHNFIAPCYYISYAVSGFTSLEIWSLSTESAEKSEEKYQELLKFGESYDYLDLLEQCGLSSPFASGSLNPLTQHLHAFLENET